MPEVVPGPVATGHHLGEELLAVGVERVRFAPHDILQVERVGLQTGRGDRLRQRRGIHREKLRLHEGPGGGKLREQLNHFLAHRLCGRDPSILIRRQAA